MKIARTNWIGIGVMLGAGTTTIGQKIQPLWVGIAWLVIALLISLLLYRMEG